MTCAVNHVPLTCLSQLILLSCLPRATTSSLVGVSPDHFVPRPGDATRTIVLYLYEQTFLFSERISGLGYGATIGWMLAVLIFIVTMAQFRFARSTIFFLDDGD